MNTDLYNQRYAMLNDEQRRAVDTLEGPVLVVAGPGSGKTELLSLRVANILLKTDLPASAILCLTFTDSAAANMQSRLASLIGAEAYRVAIHTFHSFGMSLLHRFPQYFFATGGTPKPTDDLTRFEILEEVLKELPHDNVLRSFSDDYGYSYMGDILGRISDLKKGGLAPDDFGTILAANQAFLEKANPLVQEVFAPGVRMSKALLPAIFDLAQKLSDIGEHGASFPLTGTTTNAESSSFKGVYEPLGKTVSKSLALACEQACDETGAMKKTVPVTKWKSVFLAKNHKGETVLKAFADRKKHLALLEVYQKYQQKLAEKEYTDFDDMILGAVKAMEEHPELKYTLQEQYQYVLVDEFQDTSGAQMRLVNLLLDNEVNEGRPNILAVGDDDQAIYKFQGAKLDNILQFRDRYKGTEVVVLTQNYRSTQPILDTIRAVVVTGEDRLENRLEEVTKNLVSANPALQPGEVMQKSFSTRFDEFAWVAKDVKARMERGEDLREVAVITRHHKMLAEMAKYLDFLGVAVSYERKKNIFEQPHVMQILALLKFLTSLNSVGEVPADDLLPPILAAEMWGVSRLTLWNISVTAYSPGDYKGKKLWLQVMREHEDENVRSIANFLVTVAGYTAVWTAEEVIDALTGMKPVELGGNGSGAVFTSPFREFYFGGERFEKERDRYMDYLYALQAFVQAVRNYHGGKESLSTQELVAFVDLYARHKLPLTYATVFHNHENAVRLLTAHKAKGLEFETVYVVNCTDDEWFSKGKVQRVVLPPNIPLSPAEDDYDDQMRLFYVALSRAKRNLYLTLHTHQENGKERNRLRLLEEKTIQATLGGGEAGGAEVGDAEAAGDAAVFDTTDERLREFYEMKFRPQQHEYHRDDENALLKKQLENYQLSVTHLSNFLDIERGGPQLFLERNLLRFPQKSSLALSYGNAIHKAVEGMQRRMKVAGRLPDFVTVLGFYEDALRMQRLNRQDFELYLAKGKDQLLAYYEQRKNSFFAEDIAELNFRQQNVMIGDARITGKIDRVHFVAAGLREGGGSVAEVVAGEGSTALAGKQRAEVYDVKTGKPLLLFGNDSKSVKYMDQLVFYKLLMENSRDYARYTVEQGFLEFVEAKDGEIIVLPLVITAEMVAERRRLIEVVYAKIMSLALPDVSAYEKTAAGARQFREDLLEGRV